MDGCFICTAVLYNCSMYVSKDAAGRYDTNFGNLYYSRIFSKKINKMLLFDIGIDFLLSIPFSFFLTNQVIIFLSKGEVFRVMIAIVGSQGLFLRLNIINAIILLIVISIYNQKWLKRKIEMGVALMIR